MKARNYSVITSALVLLSALLIGQNLRAAVTFSITPSAVSNNFAGKIKLQINGLTTGDSVVVQKYLDANSNGVVDSGDLLVQQFNVTDGQGGMVIGGVTNINVPGDTDGAANGAITAKLFLRNGDFFQTTIGQYLFVISSPIGDFTPQTNTFLITNLPYGQQLTGTVVSNGTSTAIPGAIVTIFPPPRQGHNGPGTPVASTVANNAGNYSIPLPPGSYVPMAFGGGYVGNFNTAQLLTLSNGQTINTTLSVSNATSTISGKYVDANSPSTGLPGVLLPVIANAGLIGSTSTASNGTFSVGVASGQTWGVGSYSESLNVLGYEGYDNNPTNVSSGASGVTVGFVKGNAMIYGTVTDNLGNPLSGISLETRDDNNGIYDEQAFTDNNGNYCLTAVGGLGNNDQWNVNVQTGNGGPATNYVFTQPNNQFDLSVGQAVQVNFSGMLATNIITGHVQDSSNNPIVGVGVYAVIQNGNYQTATVDTDNNGNYTLYVANSNVWNVTLLYCCDNDSLSSINSNYELPSSDDVGITNNSGVANFTVQMCSGIQIYTTSLPNGQAGQFYNFNLQGSTCNGNQYWSLDDPQDFPPGLNLYQNGQISGTPSSSGTYNFSVQLSDGNGNWNDQSLSLTIDPGAPQLQISTTSLPNGTNGTFYSQNLQASGGVQPYSWSLAQGSASLPANLTLSTNGTISGTPTVSGTNFSFIVEVRDATNNTAYQTLSLAIVGSGSGPLQITRATLPNGQNGLFYSYNIPVTGGQPPYTWTLAPGSANPPANLNLATNGLLAGTPVVSGTNFAFIAKVSDSASNSIQQVLYLTITGSSQSQPITLTVNPSGSGQLRFSFTTVSGQYYSIQSSQDLKHWSTVLSFTGSGGPETVSSPTSSKAMFYRVKVGQ